jgi:hypothetical protein
LALAIGSWDVSCPLVDFVNVVVCVVLIPEIGFGDVSLQENGFGDVSLQEIYSFDVLSLAVDFVDAWLLEIGSEDVLFCDAEIQEIYFLTLRRSKIKVVIK